MVKAGHYRRRQVTRGSTASLNRVLVDGPVHLCFVLQECSAGDYLVLQPPDIYRTGTGEIDRRVTLPP